MTMTNGKKKIGMSFHARIMLPVVLILGVFFSVTVWIIHRNMERQFHEEETNNFWCDFLNSI